MTYKFDYDAFRKTQGFHADGIYCQFTGRLIGWAGSEDFELLASTLADSFDSEEELHDEIAVRVLASMRPSIRWNKLAIDSIDKMRQTVPVETAAYLLNQWMQPTDYQKQTLEQRLDNLRGRVQLFFSLETMAVNDIESFDAMLFMLIDLASKFHLGNQPPMFSHEEMLVASDTDRVNIISTAYGKKLDDYRVEQEQAAKQNRWVKAGCPMNRQAFDGMMKETRYLKAATHDSIARHAKPKTLARVTKKAESSQEQDFMLSVLGGLMSEGIQTTEPAKPIAPTPTGIKAPLKLRLNIKKGQ